MSTLFSLQQISAGYGGSPVVRNITMDIQQGEFCALLGLNGSGKTTLLKAVCGLLPIQKGLCMVNGYNCTHLNERQRAQHISYIPQRHSKLQGVAVLDVVLMGSNPHLSIFESPSRNVRKKAEALLTKVDIAAFANTDFSKISEGQKQLVILARTLLQNAPAMLMDEPDSALDFLNRHLMLRRIQNLIHAEGKAGLITLHDPNFALSYCDRIFLLHNGEIIAQLTLKDATPREMEACLSLLYGNITIMEQDGQYVMLLKQN